MVCLIIGFGNIGKRHFEAIINVERIKAIYIFDICRIDLSKVFIPSTIKVTIIKNIRFAPRNIDFCIIATGSKGRELIIEKILQNSDIKNMIIEKVLFQKISSYDYIQRLLIDRKVSTFVNCPRRLMGSYKMLKKRIKNHKIISIRVYGGNWNMASNSIHFLDLFQWFIDAETMRFSLEGHFEEGYQLSKRAGYIEVFGTLIGSMNETEIAITCNRSDEPKIIEIITNYDRFVVDETKQWLVHLADNKIIDEQPFKIDFVSNLTSIAVEQLINFDMTELTPFSISADLHKKLISQILIHQNKYLLNEDEKCLIT